MFVELLRCFLGSASPQAVRKLLSLAESNKTRPHQPRQPPGPLGLITNQPSPVVRRAPSATGKIIKVSNLKKNIFFSVSFFAGSYSSYGSHSSSSCGAGGRAMHERSHSDTPTPLPSVALSAESSSVTSLSNLPLRKTLTSGEFRLCFFFGYDVHVSYGDEKFRYCFGRLVRGSFWEEKCFF